ncbi:AP2 domain-containing protein [Planctomycetota bacterium]
MAHEKAKSRCDNCCFSTFAAGPGRAALICRQKKGAEGRWTIRPPLGQCPNFYPSRAADAHSQTPRLIPLTRGKFAIVDAEDYPRLSRYTWFAEGTPKNCYAVRKSGGKSIKMHREIMHAPDHLVVDHINHDGLDNRKANLRLCTFAENCRNARRTARASSKYKGVHWHKGTKKWAAAIRFDNKTYHLGYFDNERAAAKAYDDAAKKLHGEYASLNFRT